MRLGRLLLLLLCGKIRIHIHLGLVNTFGSTRLRSLSLSGKA